MPITKTKQKSKQREDKKTIEILLGRMPDLNQTQKRWRAFLSSLPRGRTVAKRSETDAGRTLIFNLASYIQRTAERVCGDER